jgi:MoxR-like ATPase
MSTQDKMLDHFLKANQPLLITGSPGTGKTFSIYDTVVRKMGGFLITVLGSTREPVDIAGYPYKTQDSGVKIDAPHYAKVAIQAIESGKYPIVAIFFDELRRVVPAVQAALLRVFLERAVGDVQLPQEIRMLAASNPSSDGGWALESALANRMGHVQWDIDTEAWKMGMIANEFRTLAPLPAGAMDNLGRERGLIAAFISARSDLLLAYPENEELRDGAWASPRSWDMAAHVLTTVPEDDRSTRLDIIAATVGMPNAVQFLEWLDAADLPTAEDVISGKFTDIVDLARPDRTFAIISNAVGYIMRHLNDAATTNAKELTEAGWRILANANNAGAADISAAFIGKLYEVAKSCSHDVGDDITNNAEYMRQFRPLLEAAGLWRIGA